MALQDLTPQLRTRLRRVEKIVTLFVVLAALLLLVGFGYYIYKTAQNKGWFIPKCRYFTMLMSAEGLKVGDPVILMGFNVGEIVKIDTLPPELHEKIFISFDVRQPYYGYIWSDSKLHIKSNLLGGRKLEILPGFNGKPTVAEREGRPHEVLDKGKMVPIAQLPKGIYIMAKEEVAISDQAQELIAKVHEALPGVFNMTNQVAAAVANVVQITSNVNLRLLEIRPIITNVHAITANLTNQNGSLGQWLFPTNLNVRLEAAMDRATNTIASLHTTIESTVSVATNKISELSVHLNKILFDVSQITTNVRKQLDSNDTLIGNANDTLIETKDLLRGLKRHWLLKSAFPIPKLEAPPLILEPNVGGNKP
jgi:ABC-type transporter Mla subunit MlaD